MSKYGKDGTFRDPVVRCYGCSQLIRVETIHRLGMCPHCSNGRFTNVRSMNEDELNTVKAWNCDPDWIAEFTAEEVDA